MSGTTGFDRRVWKRLLLGLAVALTLMHSLRLAYWPSFAETAAELAIEYERIANTDRYRVSSVRDAAAVSGLGLEVGATFTGVHGYAGISRPEFPLPVQLDTAGGARQIEVPYSIRPVDAVYTRYIVVNGVLEAMLLLMAWLLLLRGDDSTACLLLAGVMLADAVPNMFTLPIPLHLYGGLAYWLEAVGNAGRAVALPLFVPFAMQAARPVLTAPRRRQLYAAFAVLLAIGIALTLVLTLTHRDSSWLPLRVADLFASLTVFALTLGLIAAGAAGSQGDERHRKLWLLLPVALFAVCEIAWNLLGVLGALRRLGWWSVWQILLPFQFAAWLLLTVLILKQRVIEVRLVLNRAVVYALISGLLFLTFALIELFSHKVLHAEGRGLNIVLETLAALGLVLVFRRVHHRLDHWVERVLFKRWHQAVVALAQFERHASFITDAAVLRERLLKALAGFTNAAAPIALYQLDAAGSYARRHSEAGPASIDVDVDDEAVVALRATGRAASLAGLESRIDGALVLPMLAHGRLIGFVALPAKRSKESYGADEIATLERVVGKVALDLESLRVQELQARVDLLAARNRELEARPGLDPPRPSASL